MGDIFDKFLLKTYWLGNVIRGGRESVFLKYSLVLSCNNLRLSIFIMNIVDVSLFTVVHIEILAVQVLFIYPFWGIFRWQGGL